MDDFVNIENAGAYLCRCTKQPLTSIIVKNIIQVIVPVVEFGVTFDALVVQGLQLGIFPAVDIALGIETASKAVSGIN